MSETEYEKYEKECMHIREENKAYLESFQKSLEKAGLSKKTITTHVQNADFYINEFLLRYDINSMEQGTALIGSYLGDWFIRKCMWSTPTTIKQNITSLKKFYKCMLDKGNIKTQDYELLLDIIKEEKDIWIEECKTFNTGTDDWF